MAVTAELDQIQPSFPKLNSGHETPFTFDPFGQYPLGVAFLGAHPDQEVPQCVLLFAMNGFLHARILRAALACFQIRSKYRFRMQKHPAVPCDDVDRAHEGLYRIEGLALLIESAAGNPEEIPEKGLAVATQIIREETETLRSTLARLWEASAGRPVKTPRKRQARLLGAP